jgi:hypothetical protein
MPLPHILQAIGSFIVDVTTRTLSNTNMVNAVSNKVIGTISPLSQPVLQNAETQYLQDKARREQELVAIQAQLASTREIEVKADIEISARELQLKQQFLEQQQEKLLQSELQHQQVEQIIQLQERELQLLEEEQSEQRKLSLLHLQLIQQSNAEKIDLKLKDIQAKWEQENWSGVLSRDEMRKILLEGREQHRLLMLVSPPDIEGCSDFDINLRKTVESELKSFMEDNYPLRSETRPVEFYGRFFKHSVSDAEVKQYERDLSLIPTVIIYSNVTQDTIFFHIHFWGAGSLETKTLKWDWKVERTKLEHTEGKTQDESHSIIQEIIVKLHQLLAAFWTDLYYLKVNPYHEIQLFQLESDLPIEWIRTQFEALHVFQKEQLLNYEKSLMNLESRTTNRAVINLSDSFPSQSLAERMKAHSKKPQNNSSDALKLYELRTKDEMRDDDQKIAKCSIVGEPVLSQSTEKVLMVLGATGAGKSTLINGMINYILGVKWENNFRFKLIDEGAGNQAHSQTKWVTAYTIQPMDGSQLPYKLTIIDTPGFGDTGSKNSTGLERDKLIVKQIEEFFSRPGGITHLDGIGFVAQSSLARLTDTQRYIFDSILSIFGKDIAQNIFLMLTFADGKKPPIMGAIEEAKVPYSQSFKFNNSALFAKNTLDKANENGQVDEDEEDDFDQMFWKMGVKSFQKFFSKFEIAESVSLQMTKDVLKERKQLEATVNGLLPRIKETQLKLNEQLREEAVLTKFQDQIKDNKDFTWEDTLTKQQKVNLTPGTYVTNCLVCNRTCHHPCFIPNDKDKFNCAAMKGGHCTVCNEHCSWDKHCNNSYRFELYTEKVTKTYDEIKRRYEEGKEGVISVEEVIDRINQELEELCESIFQMIQKVQRCLKRLDEIALKPNPLTQVGYITLLIDAEKREAKLGWEDRVRYYEEAKAFAVTLARANDAASVTKESNIKEWARKLISKLKDEKIQEIDAALATNRNQGVKEDSNAIGALVSWLFGR